MLKKPETRLLVVLAMFFVSNALLSEFIGVKIFSVEASLGLRKMDINLLGVPGLSFNMSAGVLTWPLVFICTDIINEYYGVKHVRFLSVSTAILIGYAFLVLALALQLIPADFWVNQVIAGHAINMNVAFAGIFGQGMWIIAGSIAAFLFGQLVDVLVFHRIKRLTGEKALWLRATGSTVVSQLVDSFVVIFIAFYLNPQYHWSWQMVAAIGLVNYSYKFAVALLMTPVLYLLHALIDKYLGKELSEKMTISALGE
ncbi:queuosine precursor transporter [Arcticibacter sp. MXS-1]|uniref:queuosine precursor transporter n=1 Tax=Arcticibacter sp. MXS-1 TaxID=3341726 RepID=UPI0035A9AA5C